MDLVRLLLLVCALASLLAALGCSMTGEATGEEGTFEDIARKVRQRGDPIVLQGDGQSRVLVSPHLQGRILTLRVGSVESTGLVNLDAIEKGEVDPHFNNFGGVDRFWIYPEAGQFGLYFPPGVDFTRSTWKVPPDFDTGILPVLSRNGDRVAMAKDMEVTNYTGNRFKVHVEREVGVLRADRLGTELGMELPAGLEYVGAYSSNVLTNRGPEKWSAEKGLIGIWILGQFNPSDECVILAPFRSDGSDDRRDLGPPYNDDYFGKLSVEAPDRFKVIGNTVCFRADSKRVGKFGIGQMRTTGIAGSIDYGKNLLTIVKFDVPRNPEPYANSSWVKVQPDPYKGDALQSFNQGVEGKPGELPEAPFYELESTSPVRPLAPGESLRHRHATHHFQGDPAKLKEIAAKLLGVDIDEVRKAMLPGLSSERPKA